MAAAVEASQWIWDRHQLVKVLMELPGLLDGGGNCLLAGERQHRSVAAAAEVSLVCPDGEAHLIECECQETV